MLEAYLTKKLLQVKSCSYFEVYLSKIVGNSYQDREFLACLLGKVSSTNLSNTFTIIALNANEDFFSLIYNHS